ncbi:hypothetical protein KEM48_006737, partial [Puccinia striiformis f. sp. tritici PST-130]
TETLVVGEAERIAVSYCTKDGYGTRLIPPGPSRTCTLCKQLTLTSDPHSKSPRRPIADENCHSRTPHYVQITALGDFTKVNVPQGDEGGELDDLEGCRWNIPGNYDGPGFDECEGEDVPHPMGECECSGWTSL